MADEHVHDEASQLKDEQKRLDRANAYEQYCQLRDNDGSPDKIAMFDKLYGDFAEAYLYRQ